jgi:hypothetical protein
MSDLSEASSIAGVLVLIRRLYNEGAVSVRCFSPAFLSFLVSPPTLSSPDARSMCFQAEEKSQLKDAVLSENNSELCDAFVQFVADNNKEALVVALLGVLSSFNPELCSVIFFGMPSPTQFELTSLPFLSCFSSLQCHQRKRLPRLPRIAMPLV